MGNEALVYSVFRGDGAQGGTAVLQCTELATRGVRNGLTGVATARRRPRGRAVTCRTPAPSPFIAVPSPAKDALSIVDPAGRVLTSTPWAVCLRVRPPKVKRAGRRRVREGSALRHALEGEPEHHPNMPHRVLDAVFGPVTHRRLHRLKDVPGQQRD